MGAVVLLLRHVRGDDARSDRQLSKNGGPRNVTDMSTGSWARPTGSCASFPTMFRGGVECVCSSAGEDHANDVAVRARGVRMQERKMIGAKGGSVLL